MYGDILEQSVDAIVSAASRTLIGSGGVEAAVLKAGGPAIREEFLRKYGTRSEIGTAGWTGGGDLPVRGVIHAMTPHAKQADAAELLGRCYGRALEAALELGARSVAFPILGTGAHDWPARRSIDTALRCFEAKEWCVSTILLVSPDLPTFRFARAATLERLPPEVRDGSVGALFEPPPEQYGLRGDPYLRRELRARLASVPVPDSTSALRDLVVEAIEEVIGRPLPAP